MDKIGAENIEIRATVFDVADWFLLKANMSNKKIQKLCYYAEAWSLAKLDQPIANNCVFEAWVHGPVNKELYQEFKRFGWKKLKIEESDIQRVKNRIEEVFTEEQQEVLSAVWDTYGEFSADQLEAQTHLEKPWLEQREGLGKFQNSSRRLNEDTMRAYYRSIAI